jgi:hypothetical protein
MHLFTKDHSPVTYIITSLVRPFIRIKCHKIKFAPVHKHRAIKDCGGVANKPHTYSIPVVKPDPEVRCSGMVQCRIPLDLSSRSALAIVLHLNSCCRRAASFSLWQLYHSEYLTYQQDKRLHGPSWSLHPIGNQTPVQPFF